MNSRILPRHVAFILDGNRRWAREKGLPTLVGHKNGYKAIEPIVDHAIALGISYLTFWAFSTENWNREKEEVSYLLGLFRTLLKEDVDSLHKKGVKIQVIGELERFPHEIVEQSKSAIEQTKNNTAITVNFGLSYGGRAEILHAVNQLIQEEKKEVTEELFSSYLYTKGQPDPDFIIRTGGEQRLSGLLPWQSVYSELYFTKTYWPDFDSKAFDMALNEFANRNRRFGK